MSIPGNVGGGIRGTIVKTLTTISNVTAPFISVFLLVHLSAPVLANVGGTNLASQTMLLGREYYQSERGETYLVLGPIVLHALAGATKRLLTSTSSNNQNKKTPSTLLNRPFTSLLSLTAYSTALIFLPFHFLIHRDYPTLPIEPIHSVGPASLDYEFVKYGLRTWPWRSWVLYVGLVGSVVLHFADGSAQVWKAFMGDGGGGGGGWSGLSRNTRRGILVCGVAVPVILGLRAMAKEPLMILKFLEDRYHAVFTQSIAYQL